MPEKIDTTEINDPSTSSPLAFDKLVFSLPVDHDGTSIYVKGWHKEHNTNSPVIILHDFGENISSYRILGQQLAKFGHNVYGSDLRGHGRSGKSTTSSINIKTYVNDLLQICAWVKHQEKGRLPIIIANGLSGQIVLNFCKKHPTFCRAIVLASPVTQLKNELSDFKFAMLKIANELLPNSQMPQFLLPKLFDNNVPKDSKSLIHSDQKSLFSISFTLELLKKIRSTKMDTLSYKAPILILCPEEDHICTYKKLKKNVAMHDQHNMRLIDLPNCQHNIFTAELASTKIAISHLKQWIKDIPDIEHQITDRQSILDKQSVKNDSKIVVRPGASKNSIIESSVNLTDEL